MGDTRFHRHYRRILDSEDPVAVIKEMADEELIAALAATSHSEDPFLANVLATEAQNRVRRKGTIVEQAAEGLISVDAAGALTYINPAGERMLGYEADELRGQFIHDIIHQDEQGNAIAEEPCAFTLALSEGKTTRGYETVFRRADGSVFPVEVTAAPIKRDGDITGAVLSFDDISDVKEAEQALREAEQRCLLTVGSTPDYAIFMLDPEGRICTWNTGAERLKGYREEEILGKPIEVMYPEEARREGRPQHNLRKALENGRHEDEGWRLRKDGTCFWADVVVTPIYTPGGRHVGYAKVTRDRTSRKKAEERYKCAIARFATGFVTLAVLSLVVLAFFTLYPTDWPNALILATQLGVVAVALIASYAAHRIWDKQFAALDPHR
ncbi:MAG TPA: PAS domain S-box protein [Candidatus Thermoplasmatota archaeon]|nr:PAS domain S-box protein [Candidatus Thermoplasmatota archaeon]